MTTCGIQASILVPDIQYRGSTAALCQHVDTYTLAESWSMGWANPILVGTISGAIMNAGEVVRLMDYHQSGNDLASSLAAEVLSVKPGRRRMLPAQLGRTHSGQTITKD